jgi:hypothetical protein
MAAESAFTYSSNTWLYVLSRGTGKETIWEMLTRLTIHVRLSLHPAS